MIRVLWAALVAALVGCSALDPWSQDGIVSSDGTFASKRLSYAPTSGYPPWRIEFFREGEELRAFVSLMRHRFRPADFGRVRVRLSLEGEVLEELTTLFEGGMKVKLSDRLTNSLIRALQEGKKVSILVGEWEETLEAASFKRKFTKLMDDSREWLAIQTPLK